MGSYIVPKDNDVEMGTSGRHHGNLSDIDLSAKKEEVEQVEFADRKGRA